MKIFVAKGSFQNGKFKQNFTKEISSVSQKLATEKVFADFGSKHRCKRRQITITEIVEKKTVAKKEAPKKEAKATKEAPKVEKKPEVKEEVIIKEKEEESEKDGKEESKETKQK